MGTLVTLTRQTTTLQGFQLLTPADMTTALEYITPGGGLAASTYVGSIQGPTASGGWALQINNNTLGTSVVGYLNDWVILDNNATVTICPNNVFASLYVTT